MVAIFTNDATERCAVPNEAACMLQESFTECARKAPGWLRNHGRPQDVLLHKLLLLTEMVALISPAHHGGDDSSRKFGSGRLC
jgi:hypothetical protein